MAWNFIKRLQGPQASRTQRAARLRVRPVCELMELRVLLSAAPVSITGDTIMFFQTAGTGSDTPPGVSQLVLAASGNTFTTHDLIYPATDGTGTYTYATTSATTATIVLTATGGSQSTITLDFSAGTLHVANPDSSTEDDNFVIASSTASNLSPTTVSGDIITLNIATGSGTQLATSGSYQITPAASGNTYVLESLSGSTISSTGTATYTQSNAITGTFAYVDSITGTGTLFLAFTSANAGAFYNTDASATNALTDFHAGTFHLTDAATHAKNVAYVSQLYTDLLKRSLDGTGTARWVGGLDAGTYTDADVATGITGSREYDGDVVDGFYVTYLHRHAEPGASGIEYWINQMQSGLNAEVIRAGILGSDEYFNDVGGDNTSFITALYETFLGRPPENAPTGLPYWLGVLQADVTNGMTAGQAREAVSAAISNSDENRIDVVTSFYETFLQRAPDPAGLANWVQQLANGVSQPAIITAFVTSPEYLALHNFV
jgi:hypothetical protein